MSTKKSKFDIGDLVIVKLNHPNVKNNIQRKLDLFNSMLSKYSIHNKFGIILSKEYMKTLRRHYWTYTIIIEENPIFVDEKYLELLK